MDALKNFAYSLVATAPSPATSGTSLTVTAGQGAYFPATPFDATIWPAGAQPLNSNAEIVRVTAVSTDTFTITRAQYGTTAQAITAGYQIAQTVDANLLSQLAPLSGATFTGEVVAPDFKVSGLTGANAVTSRFVGSTTAGAPTTGTFSIGDYIIDQTGTVWICITAGSPGTWTPSESLSVYATSSSYTATNGQAVVVNGSATGITITMSASPVEGSEFIIINNNSNNITLKANTGQSLFIGGTNYGAGVGYTVNPNGVYQFIYDPNTTHWFATATNDIGDTINNLPTSRGGTGLTTFTAANNAIYSTSSSALTAGTLPVLAGGTGVTTSTGSGSTVLSTNPVLIAPFETVSTSSTTLNSSNAASLSSATAGVFLYTSNPSSAYTIALTGAPTTTGQAVTYVLGVLNGSTSYLPNNITVNGNVAGASSTVLPLQGATNNGVTSYYQGGALWTSTAVSTYVFYTLTVISTGSSTWTMLLSLVTF